MKGWLGAVGACGLLLAVGAAPAWAAPEDCRGAHWVGSWTAAPSHASPTTATPVSQTIRMIVTTHLGGKKLRLRFTNRYRDKPVRLDRVTVAKRATGPSVYP